MKTSIALAGILLAGTSIISAQAINGAVRHFRIRFTVSGSRNSGRRILPSRSTTSPKVLGRYRAAYRRHGGFRRVRHADEGRADRGTEGEGAALSDGAGRLGADLQSARLGGSEVFIGDVGRIFLGKITKWNDAKIAKANPASNCRPPTSSWCIAPMAAVPLSCSPIIFRRSARNGKPVRERIPPSSGRRVWANRETKASPEW